MTPKLIEEPSCFSKDDPDLDDLDREALRRLKEIEENPEIGIPGEEFKKWMDKRLKELEELGE